MKVLLLGITGRVGSRMLPALLAHQHKVVAYVRSPNKVPAEASGKLESLVVGSATDSAAIKDAIIAQNCDAVVNAAGLAPMFSRSQEFPQIFAAVVKAAVDAGKERDGPPLRCWFLSGFSCLDSPKKPVNLELIQSQPSDKLAWSLFCANNMPPNQPEVMYAVPADLSAKNLVAKSDSPPAWKDTLKSVPLLGIYLNIMAQAQAYYTPLEDCVDFLATDLEKGLESEYVGKRVGVKVKET